MNRLDDNFEDYHIENPVICQSFYLMEDALSFSKYLKESGIYCDIKRERTAAQTVFVGESNQQLIHVLISEKDIQQADELLENSESEFSEELDSIKDEFDEEKIERDLYPKEGVEAPTIYIVVGFITACLGGLIGILIGYSFWNSMNTNDKGETYFHYNKSTRTLGKLIFFLGLLVFIVSGIIMFKKL